jgi:hypothetical protein
MGQMFLIAQSRPLQYQKSTLVQHLFCWNLLHFYTVQSIPVSIQAFACLRVILEDQNNVIPGIIIVVSWFSVVVTLYLSLPLLHPIPSQLMNCDKRGHFEHNIEWRYRPIKFPWSIQSVQACASSLNKPNEILTWFKLYCAPLIVCFKTIAKSQFLWEISSQSTFISITHLHHIQLASLLCCSFLGGRLGVSRRRYILE